MTWGMKRVVKLVLLSFQIEQRLTGLSDLNQQTVTENYWLFSFPPSASRGECVSVKRSTKKQMLVNGKGGLPHLNIIFIIYPVIFPRTMIMCRHNLYKCRPLRKPIFIPTQFYSIICNETRIATAEQASSPHIVMQLLINPFHPFSLFSPYYIPAWFQRWIYQESLV